MADGVEFGYEMPVSDEIPVEERHSTPDGPIGRLLVARFEKQHARLVKAGDAARRGEKQAVHDLRVAMRRLRSALATFRPYVDRSVTDPLRDELRWAAGTLGEIRDREVVGDRIESLLRHEPANLVVGPIVARVDAEFGRARTRPPKNAVVTLDSERYEALLSRLDTVITDPPLTIRAEKRARKQAARHVSRELERMLSRALAAACAVDDHDRAALLHETRKAAKRLRYAAEVARPVTGTRVRRVGRKAKRLQEVLGDHHDAWAVREALYRMAVRADERSESSFTYGRLHALEQCRAAALDQQASTLIEGLDELRRR